MQTATYVSLSSQTALERGMDVLANNMANMSTPSFKGQSVLFAQYLQAAPGGGTIAYVRDVGVRRDTKQGELKQTGNPLDAGIDGDGYFTVETQDGPRYTRNGRFQLDAGGTLVNAQGNQLLSDQGQPITMPANTRRISIADDGQVSTETGPVAKIGLSHFDNQQDLVAVADGLYATDDEPAAATTSKLHQGSVEESNVNAMLAMTKLLGLQKAYTGAATVIDGEDTRIKNAIDKISHVV
jgi:flagellar basal-body rod protein FlgF